MSTYAYTGINRSGASTYGRGADDDTPVTLAKRLYHKRFRQAEIKDDTNTVVGGVTRNENGARVWWADTYAR